MVDAQSAGVAQDALHERPVRRVAQLAQPVGAPRRQPPVLALLVERVGRGAHGGAERERVLQRPGVGPAGVDPDGEVVHDPDRHADRPPRQRPRAARRRAAAPSTRTTTRSACSSRAAATPRASGRRSVLGPVLPRRRRAPRRARRTARSRSSACPRSARYAASAPARAYGQSSSSAASFASTPCPAVDPLGVGRRAQRGHPRPQLGGRRRVLGHVLDAQLDRRAEAPARRRVGRGVERRSRPSSACRGLSSRRRRAAARSRSRRCAGRRSRRRPRSRRCAAL